MHFNTIHIVLAILLSVSQISLVAQNQTDANIFGHVVLQSNHEHLPYINITLKGTSIGTSTDISGHYFLKNLPEGTFTLIASGMGYTSQERVIKTEAGKSIEVDFELKEDAIQLSSVVVSASRNEVNRKESPVVVNILSPKIFESSNSNCVAQGLNFQPGLRVETNCQNCGYQQVRINGLDGPYSQILIDSRAIFSSLAAVYGLEQIPTSMVERIEVVRGGGSALFGSSAIGGTINIITKEPTKNSFQLSNTVSSINAEALDIHNSFNISVISDNTKSGILFFGSLRNRDGWDANGDEFTEIPIINSKNMGFRSFYRTSDYSKLSVEYHNLWEYRRGGNKLDVQPHESDIAEQLEHHIHTGGIRLDVFDRHSRYKFSLYSSAQSISRDSYYGAGQDLNAYGHTTDFSWVSGGQFVYSFSKLLFMPAEVIGGIEYNLNELEDIVPGYHRNLVQSTQIASLFAQSEWKNESWSLLAGMRLDKHNLLHNPVLSPRLNIRYSPADNLSFRASISTGFRAPQAFDEDLHISIAGGEPILIELDPDLMEEKSISYSASAHMQSNLGHIQFDILAEAFYTRLNHAFILKESALSADSVLIYLRTNGSGAIVQGFNFEGIMVPGKFLSFQLGVTLQKSQYLEPEKWSEQVEPQQKMFRTPNLYGYFTSNVQFNKSTELALTGTYTGSMYVQHFAGFIQSDEQLKTPDFFDLNLKLSHKIAINGTIRMSLQGGIQNIFNAYQKDFDFGPHRDSGFIYGPAAPRSFFLGLVFGLN